MSLTTEFPGVALVTGAGGTGEDILDVSLTIGIGNAVAKAFVLKGCTRLVITDISKQTLSSTEDQIKQLAAGRSIDVLALSGDVSSPEFVDSFFKAVYNKFGRLDYAVNCAGVLGNNRNSVDSSFIDFDRINAVNYRGVWACSRKELEIMQGQDVVERPGYGGARRQRGSIVNVASQLGLVGRVDARKCGISVRPADNLSHILRIQICGPWTHSL